ncbi:unnamed protein product [Clonostachys rosea]|uniref:RING-type domain-containing protein n=1 Tax=Bionectria ochroleuca TaxID=29856 RepID=A0ABY6TTY5_BIOOC|nr:unnamed protein product [Clonostachys rosea]
MMFPGLLSSSDGSSSKRSKANTNATTSSSSSKAKDHHHHASLPGFIFEESQLPPPPPEAPDLRELNNSLEALAAIFPDVQIEVFRELLSNFDDESRLAVVVDALLKNRVTWVKGRWRVEKKGEQSEASIPTGELFRSKEYIKAVQSLALHEFKGLSRSTIHAVLAESNYSYLDARQTLVTLSSKSWRFTISALFLRRKAVTTGEAHEHPLVVWRSSGHGSIFPAIRATRNAQLDRELFTQLIVPIKEREKQEREANDRDLAVKLNNEEAEAADATHECACCYIPGAFEEFTHCNSEGHMICHRCVQHSIKEAVFGQGWLSSINPDTGTLKCIAADGSGCLGHIPSDHIRRAMEHESKGDEILRKLDQRLAEHSLLASGFPLIRCPFCNYAEIDDIYMPPKASKFRLRLDNVIPLTFLLICMLSAPILSPIILIATVFCLMFSSQHLFGGPVSVEWKKAVNRHRRRARGLKFTCQNAECAQTSCLSCNKAWADVHICNESSLVALRTQVEQAMSMAVKRVCPRCNTSFVKNAGCNKLTCPCGYKMCYVCRADLGDEGYRHFCDHFRPDGDPTPCKECDRCNLWESEDTERILREAREEAERNWKQKENRDLSGADVAFLETGFAAGKRDIPAKKSSNRWSVPTLGEVFDFVLNTIFI